MVSKQTVWRNELLKRAPDLNLRVSESVGNSFRLVRTWDETSLSFPRTALFGKVRYVATSIHGVAGGRCGVMPNLVFGKDLI